MNMTAMVLLLLSLATAARGQSALDGFDPNANGTVRAVVVQPDGKILLGGDFTTLSPNGGAPVTRNHIARLNPDGTLDIAFNPNANGACAPSMPSQCRRTARFWWAAFHQHRRTDAQQHRPARCHDRIGRFVQPEREQQCLCHRGAGGRQDFSGRLFNSIGGQSRNRIARLDPATGLADSFDPDANGPVFSIAVQADGKILAGGVFNAIGGQTRNRHRAARSHDRPG